ncbi:MAG: cytochrome c [Acidobacteria bacterium]|nr:cytochrome c [Acidobacteriota bacterium]
MRFNLILAALLLLTAFGNVVVRPDPSKPNAEYLPNMVHPISFGSFDANPNFADGKTSQEAPPHTIRRGFRSLDYEATPEEAMRAGEELKNPLNVEDLNVFVRGAALYRTFCVPCHGAAGRGDGAVAMHGYPAPPPFLNEKALAMKDGQMFHILTFGQKNMPSYAVQVAPEDRWKVILYVRSLQRSQLAAQAADEEAAAPQTTGQPNAPREVKK